MLILLYSNSDCILDSVSFIPSAVHLSRDCYLIGLAGNQVLGSGVGSTGDILSLYSPLACEVYSYSVLLSVFNFVPCKSYLVVLFAVIYLDVGGVGNLRCNIGVDCFKRYVVVLSIGLGI